MLWANVSRYIKVFIRNQRSNLYSFASQSVKYMQQCGIKSRNFSVKSRRVDIDNLMRKSYLTCFFMSNHQIWFFPLHFIKERLRTCYRKRVSIYIKVITKIKYKTFNTSLLKWGHQKIAEHISNNLELKKQILHKILWLKRSQL